jgi:F-type H+-transporting ATPase subunit delta
MARRDTSARRYAEAAFEVARADGTLDAWERDMATIGATMRHPELRALLQHPAVAFADKERVLRKVMGRGVASAPMNLILLMVRRERGVALAEIRTALPLDDAQRGSVTERLAELTGDKIEINEVVDPGLIGGITVRSGDRLFDASVRSRLERLRARLTAV